MSIENEFGFIGWSTEGTSDKIWGYFYRPTPGHVQVRYGNPNLFRNICIFWGRRGKAMQFKAGVHDYDLDMLRYSKLHPKKGYVEIDQTKLMAIWPSFIEEAEAKLMWAVLAGKVK
jgi:hypothetical protein